MKKFSDFANDKKRGEREQANGYKTTAGNNGGYGGQNGQIPAGAFPVYVHVRASG